MSGKKVREERKKHGLCITDELQTQNVKEHNEFQRKQGGIAIDAASHRLRTAEKRLQTIEIKHQVFEQTLLELIQNQNKLNENLERQGKIINIIVKQLAKEDELTDLVANKLKGRE